MNLYNTHKISKADPLFNYGSGDKIFTCCRVNASGLHLELQNHSSCSLIIKMSFDLGGILILHLEILCKICVKSQNTMIRHCPEFCTVLCCRYFTAMFGRRV